LFNIYAPCEPRAKQELWASLSVRLQLLGGEKVYFSLFIDNNGLIDLSLCGCRFTCYKGHGTSMSRLDRFLLSEEWCLQWPNCFQVALLRGLYDHCLLQLSVDEEN